MTAPADAVIVGGAAMGSSVAAHLLADPGFQGRVVVVEKDLTYRLAASALSAASIRQQYSQPVNIRLSLYGIDFLRNAARHFAADGDAPPGLGLVEPGYLYLAGSAEQAELLRTNHAVQAREGADIALLGPDELQDRFPWVVTGDLALGSLGLSGEGWFDGWTLLQAFRRKARRLGAEYVADEVVAFDREKGRITAVRLRSGGRLPCGAVVNAGGSGGPAIAAMAGVALPVRAKRRSVFSFACPTPLPFAPLLIDPTGVWVRPEGRPGADGQTFICGWSPPPEHDPDWWDDDPDTQIVDDALFEERIWPALAARVPAFETIRPGRAWAGPYDMNLFDHNALVGPAAEVENLHLCNGFSGHGLQHSPGIGRGIAELLVHGRFLTLDLSKLSPARVAAGRPLLERNVI